VSYLETFRRIVRDHQKAVSGLDSISEPVDAAASAIANCLASGKKILFCGNGGSAADAQHLAAEFVGRFQKERRALPALALHTDTSALTSIANDFGFDTVYERQIEAHGREGDILVALSTSGNSPSIVRGVERGREFGLKIIGMTGASGGILKDVSHIWIGVPSDVTARIQECHILIGHFLCEAGEESF
jgi:D-sedoheptulose 7-phosphate isomerase